MRGQDLKQYSAEIRAAENKVSFDEVFGDPFSQPEPTVGHYETIKSRGIVQAMQNNFDEGVGTRNPACPSITDFVCDVERTLAMALSPVELVMFLDTYMYELKGKGTFNQGERSRIEQRVGKALRDNHISPVSKYFTSIRRNVSYEHTAPRGAKSPKQYHRNYGA